MTEFYSVELEQQILGACFASKLSAEKAIGMIKPDHFAEFVHAEIFKVIAQRHSEARAIDANLVFSDFTALRDLEKLGGKAYLVKIAASAVSQSMVGDYCKELILLSRKRDFAEALDAAVESLKMGKDVSDSIGIVEAQVSKLDWSDSEPKSVSILSAFTKTISRKLESLNGEEFDIPTGIKELDDYCPLLPGELTIIGGATSMGKTAFSMWLAYSAATRGHGVGVVSLEMTDERLADRILALKTKIPYKALRKDVSSKTLETLGEAANSLRDLPIQIIQSKVREIPSIISETRKLMFHWQPNGEFKGLRLLIVDYLQMVKGTGKNRHEQLNDIANELKEIAKSLNIHVVALAQVNRVLGLQDDPRPKLSHLAGSSGLENAADNVMFCYRPEYYLSRETPPKKTEDRADWEAALSASKNVMEVIVAKQRMGEVGTKRLKCDIGTNRFWSDEDQQNFWEG